MIKRYEDCVTRLENRGSYPPTREYVDKLVEGLRIAGIEASWHSAVDPLGRALFPSKVYPNCHPQASLESFRYLIDSLHAIGRPALSWYPLNLCRGILDAHPDWVMKFIPMEGVKPNDEFAKHYCCFNSPYGDLLPQFAAEVVRDIGFDGLWFDGSTYSNHNTGPAFQPACGCDFCRNRFKRDTGLDLPEKVDFSRREFRVWVNWRYDVLMGMWKKVLDAVLAVRPDALVCFNNYRRRSSGQFAWNTGIPMRRLGWDMMMSGELDGFPTQADFQMKMHRAYGCRRGVESWWPLCDHWHVWVPDMEPLTATQAMLSAMSAGGALCTGVGVEARLVTEPLRAMQKAGTSLLPFRDGEPIEYAAIWCSQQTQDFYFQDNPEGAFNQMHGANELCLQAHFQSSVVFDDHVADGDLARYPVLLAANSACVSGRQAGALRRYVEEGGVLFACAEAGQFDELGYPHEHPVLDDLLGIRSRQPSAGNATLEFPHDGPIAKNGCRGLSYSARFVVAEPAPDTEVLAHVADRTTGSWDGIETGTSPFVRYSGLWRRRVGKGWIVYSCVDLFGGHLGEPMARTVAVFRALLTDLVVPMITAEAPLCVTLNARRLADERTAVILHNAPGTVYRYPAPSRSNYIHAPGEIAPLSNLTICLNGMRCRTAVSGLTGKALRVTRNGARIRIPRLETHEVVIIETV